MSLASNKPIACTAKGAFTWIRRVILSWTNIPASGRRCRPTLRNRKLQACKWVSIRERNREKYDLPTVFSILIYTHPETGFPLAICDGSYHTVMRTGAAAAVSAKWMARKNSKRLAIVGAGL